jgi:hypothetical protein
MTDPPSGSERDPIGGAVEQKYERDFHASTALRIVTPGSASEQTLASTLIGAAPQRVSTTRRC